MNLEGGSAVPHVGEVCSVAPGGRAFYARGPEYVKGQEESMFVQSESRVMGYGQRGCLMDVRGRQEVGRETQPGFRGADSPSGPKMTQLSVCPGVDDL